MDQVVPWIGLLGLIEPFYPKADGGRKPYPQDTMLRIHLLQNWFSLSDPAMEEALYEITPMRQFARLTLSAPIPEDTTIMNFRHLLEKHQLAPCNPRGHQRLSARKRPVAAPRHHRRCHHHSCPQLDQERGRQARSRDASDQER
jgi:hypothetical protein